ncbi:MAG TPA: beta-galactosidase GalA [Candidatus Cybelea sp.]|nr:beta-galactosidase GalA [Candidatus Cybelea sp.]
MPHFTRRDLLKGCIAASAEAVMPLPPAAGAERSGTTTGARAGRAAQSQPSGTSQRERFLLDFGWHFHLGHADNPAKDFEFGAMGNELLYAKSDLDLHVAEPTFDDSAWRSVDLPHDWAVELPFRDVHDLASHGGHPLGRNFPETSVGWYRRVFELAASDAGKRLSIDFDGVFRDAVVIFNNHYMGRNFSGYAPFHSDVTDFAEYGGRNVLLVRVDATLGEGWFYEGAGIYRHVWLTKTNPVHVAQWGNYVRSEIQGSSATLVLSTEIENESDRSATCRAVSRIVDGQGKTVATARSEPAELAPWEKRELKSEARLDNALLWSLEERHLYRAVTTIESNGAPTDQDETTFGIRSIRFDPNQGFFLNGKPVKIKGTCNHQDHAGVGAALPDRLQYYRIERLIEMGSNGYRTSHNPPTPELLDACDRLGMLVLDETRMMSSSEEGLGQLERMIRRDRNHPSIVMWSLGNEEPDQGSPLGVRMVSVMKRLAHELDPSRPVTAAMNGSWGRGISAVVDVQGFNYGDGLGSEMGAHIDAFHAKFTQQPTLGTETASDVATRGIYANDKARGYVSAYDVNYPSYTVSAEDWWKVYAQRPFLSGAFAWTGFDYRGEPSPYDWPCISSHFGIMDTCGFPKDTFYYYQSWWGSQPVVHLFPHWNWAGKEGQEIDVWCFTNLDRVELFLNGASLGAKQVEPNSHLEWKVSYAPGVLEARASKNGQVVLVDKRETTGAPSKLSLRADRQKIRGDGEDVSVIAVEVRDRAGRVVPTAMNEVRFRVSGAGRLIGVGNGDPSCHESDRGDRRSAFNGLCMALVQALKQSGEIQVEASADGLEAASLALEAEPAAPRPAVA